MPSQGGGREVTWGFRRFVVALGPYLLRMRVGHLGEAIRRVGHFRVASFDRIPAVPRPPPTRPWCVLEVVGDPETGFRKWSWTFRWCHYQNMSVNHPRAERGLLMTMMISEGMWGIMKTVPISRAKRISCEEGPCDDGDGVYVCANSVLRRQ